MKRRINISNSLLAGAVFATAMLGTHVATAQVANDPTELGGGKKAYIVLIIDSSASMEYTTEGDNIFPTSHRFYPALVNPPPGVHTNTTGIILPSWSPGDAINAGGVDSFGSCFVYHPSTGCGAYQRPGWRPSVDATWPVAQPPANWAAGSPFLDPEDAMRGTYDPTSPFCTFFNLCNIDSWRLQNPTQPRHVTVKEILTGNMIMLPSNAGVHSFAPNFYDSQTFGPGCWFIPRQRDASLQPLADQTYCEGDTAFDGIPDYDQPVPHFQEVYDLQQPTGVLDTLATTALFAVAAFDGYRERPDDPTTATVGDAWGSFAESSLNNMNDNILNSPPDDLSGIRADTDEDDADCDEDASTPNDPCYNLGIWHVVGPATLDVPNSLLPQLAAYSQIAVNDTGYLTKENGATHTLFSDDIDSQTNSYLGATFSAAFQNYVRTEVPLGKQPVARATPIAAAMQDMYQFLAYGQQVDGSVEDPVNTDTFVECRPKHVVMLTDGQPSPERDPNEPTGVSDTLNEAFGYEPARYKYDTAEQEIALLTNDVQNIVPPLDSAPAYELNKYEPRVHVLGLNLETADDEAIAKMAQMAIEGKSCASALVPELVPNTHTYVDTAGDPQNGTCVPTTGCLVDQSTYVSNYLGGSAYEWLHPQDETIDIDCSDFPALILDNNDPDQLGAALSSFLSSLVQSSGLTTRTKVAISDRLDDVSIPGGGQYRLYSGVRVGGSAWWKGVINRNTIRCDGAATDELSIDQEIALQVEMPAVDSPIDGRRVWTAMPSETIWDYAGGGLPATPLAPGDPDFPMRYALQQVANASDEFQETYLTNDLTGEDMVLGSRVPFEYSFIDSAYPGATTPFDHFNVFSPAEFTTVTNVFRGRIVERMAVGRNGNVSDIDGEPQDRVLGGILNSNPLVIGPPELDLPIASYRDFRARFADRTSMMYVASMDGLLHAIHLGELEDRINVRAPVAPNAARAPDALGSAFEQREAWAYMPWMLTRDLSSYKFRQAYLMDGSPVSKDVRLCSPIPSENTNPQACEASCQGGCSRLEGADQWRTVLVQGRGLAGAGYFAMDVTRPGGLQFDDGGARSIENPDPILLWEFDREWEAAQVGYWMDTGEGARVGGAVDPAPAFWDTDQCNHDVDQFWRSSLMGLSVSEVEIGTVIINGRQRAVAVFGGGSLDVNATGCAASASGMAIYVVDLQTGSLIRRFTHYEDATEVPFATGAGSTFIGSPALFDGSTGSVATRGFIGDDTGRLFKIDMLDQDPLNWEVSLFFEPDPVAYPELTTMLTNAGHSGSPAWGPAAYRPAVTVNANRDVVVVYGLGETGDVVTNNQAQAVIAVVEDRSAPTTGIGMWIQVFEPEEKITGAPMIFNGDVYFPTYALPTNVCEPGYARIWGLDLVDTNPATLADTDGIFDNNPTFSGVPPAGIQVDPTGGDTKWFGPEDPALIRGLTISLGPLCALDDFGSNTPSFTTDNNPQPRLIAQTSNPVATGLTNTDQVSNPLLTNALDRLVSPIAPPDAQTIPLSWSLVY